MKKTRAPLMGVQGHSPFVKIQRDFGKTHPHPFLNKHAQVCLEEFMLETLYNAIDSR